MRSIYETATRECEQRAVLPGTRESLDCFSVRDGAFYTRNKANKRGDVLAMAALSLSPVLSASFINSLSTQ